MHRTSLSLHRSASLISEYMMPNSGLSGGDDPDLNGLISSIGTWVAVALAIVALVGVVGPLLALEASARDKNRAMNAFQDQQQKYVSREFHLTRGLRVFRRIRVPNLSPGYIANEPETSPLVPSLCAALERWVLKPRDYLPWNSGWAKFSELIEAYEVRDGTNDGLVDATAVGCCGQSLFSLLPPKLKVYEIPEVMCRMGGAPLF